MTPTQANRLAKIREAGTLRVTDGLRAADHWLKQRGLITWESTPAPRSRIGFHYHLTATDLDDGGHHPQLCTPRCACKQQEA